MEQARSNNEASSGTSELNDGLGILTGEDRLTFARRMAHEKLREAEKAWHAYAALCDVGPDRVHAFEVFENVRTATLL